MRPIIAAAVLLISLHAAAGTLTPRSHSLEAVGAGTRREAVLEKALRTFVFDDGTEWITHVVTAPNESSPMGVTRFDRHGDAHLFLASDWLPKGTIPGGSVGQIYAVAPAGSADILATLGWNDRGEVHNAIVTLHPKGDGYEVERIIEVAGAGDIAAGPRGTIVAVTSDASAPAGGPLLTMFDVGGRVIGTAFPRDAATGARGAASNAIRARLQRLSDSRYCLYDPARDTASLFEWNGSRLTITREIVTGGDEAPVVAITGSRNGQLLIARTGMFGGAPGTIVTAYDSKGSSRTWRSPHPWNAALAANGKLRGVVAREGVRLESVDFDGE